MNNSSGIFHHINANQSPIIPLVNLTANIPVPLLPVWGYDAILTTVCSVLTFTLNSFIASILLTHSELRSSFSVYLITLLIFDALLCLHGWLNIARKQFPSSMANITLCDFRSYVSWVITGIPLNLHVLIAVNRVWAIAFPYSYKNRHSNWLAIALTFVVVAYVHIICLPGVIMNALYYRLPFETDGCQVNTDPGPMMAWDQLVMLLIYEFPIVFMAVAWIYVAIKQKQRRNAIANATTTAQLSAVTSAAQKTGGRRGQYSTGFLVFSVLTASAILCWTPYETYYTVWAFIPDLTEADRRFVNLCLALYLFQPVLDPLLTVVTMKDLRRVIAEGFLGCIRK
ncbi:uncharacterized protein LOC129596347 [Paramacrobiotus metropolitanus]|uniref:uncharacterized protein LOC129596347 n=1 Tax=Paramacrobiotus metropolitanus TaxID=2943436 RepID=UPI0024463377|nr:uncharacterized protein LOC129596347 [Paramacrobiotus metropolitanus]